jgi:DNA-binding winged helix-turn-helix (wHTH) protein/predicted ATPase
MLMMTRANEEQIVFGPYCLDPANALLLYGAEPVGLTPKAFDVLHHLASRPDRLVTKNDLMNAIWPDVIVSDASIKVCVREIRQALADDIKSPKYIETVHRRGYRFIGRNVRAKGAAAPSSVSICAEAEVQAPAIVGRVGELRKLHEGFNRAAQGHRQCMFITGAPGSGKTALAQSFIEGFASSNKTQRRPLILLGHCFEQFGASEPYLPIWESLVRASSEQQSRAIDSILAARTAAYTHSASPSAMPSHTGSGSAGEQSQSSHRMLSEIADALESLAETTPVVLLLEDVHWADYSTLDLISALARRRTPAQLMIVASYRPAEIAAEDHPLRSIVENLVAARFACELPLVHLDARQVAQYLSLRVSRHELPENFAVRLRHRTGGHPLFLVHLVNDLIDQGVLTQIGDTWLLSGDGDSNGWLAVLETQVPDSVRAMIDSQLDRLSRDEHLVLEGSAVAGVEFSAAAAAAAIGQDIVHVESICDDLARRHQFLESRGIDEWPDGTIATHYRFSHELCHNVVYKRLTGARRARLHRTLGQRLEPAWGDRAPEDAANLSVHFEEGRDWLRALVHLRRAADAATRQYAHREALQYLRRAHAACQRLPEEHRAQHELPVLMLLGVNLQVIQGCATPEVESIFARATALCELAGDIASTFPVLWGIWVFHKVRSDLVHGEQLARRLLAMAETSGDRSHLLQAHQAMCVTSLCLGRFPDSHHHMEQAAALYDPGHHPDNTRRYGQDPGVSCFAFGAVALQLMNRVEEAKGASERALELARQLSQPTTLALALHFAAMLEQCRGNAAATERYAQESMDLSHNEGFSFWLAGSRILRGWAWAAQGGAEVSIAEIRRGIEAWLATGSRTYITYYQGLLADALLRHKQPIEAIATLDEAIQEASTLPEHLYERELRQLRERAAQVSKKEIATPPERKGRGRIRTDE